MVNTGRATPQDTENGTSASRESQAKAMIELALAESINLFHDERKEPYIRIKNSDVLITIKIRSKDAKIWLSGLLWKAKQKAPNSESLSSTINVLEAIANEGPEYKLYNRVALDADVSIWLDLCNNDWEAIHITNTGWEVVKQPPILFRRYLHQQPIPTPVRGGSLAPLLDYANITHLGDQLLYVVSAISNLIPEIPHVVLVFYGSQGSGKTWALRVIRTLIDPSQLDLLSLPNRYQELIQNLDHHWCAFYDNVGRLPDWLSNALCRAVTGTGFSKRQLYTDDDDFIYRYHRCLGLTDINIAAERGDLLQRTVLLGLSTIPADHRKTERDLKANLEAQRPQILGAMLDVLVKAMKIYPTVKTSALERMADFTMWGIAITDALGLDNKHFLDSYQENISAQNLEAVRANPISDALILLITLNPLGWSGTAAQLYTELEEKAKELKISTKQKAWPKKPHVLSRVLNDLVPSLPSVGIVVNRGYSGKDRIINITTSGSVGSVGDPDRQTDWGKGNDLKAYLKTDDTVASDDVCVNLTGNQSEGGAHEPDETEEVRVSSNEEPLPPIEEKGEAEGGATCCSNGQQVKSSLIREAVRFVLKLHGPTMNRLDFMQRMASVHGFVENDWLPVIADDPDFIVTLEHVTLVKPPPKSDSEPVEEDDVP